MIVARIYAAAEAVLKDITATSIESILNTAASLSGSRANIPDNQWSTEVDKLRLSAKSIMENDIVKIFPQDMRNMLFGSGYSSALPSNIAKVIFHGMSHNKASTISSSELSVYQGALTNLKSELMNMLGAFKKFKLDAITIPEGAVSVDILIPRDIVQDDIYYFSKVNNAFADLISSFERLSGNPRANPKLVYSSTTDLVTGMTIAITALTPFLIFYNQILDCAKKQLDIIQGFKTLRNLSIKIDDKELEERAIDGTRADLDKAVAEAFKEGASNVSDLGEANEILNMINIKSKTVVMAVENGARVSVTVESMVSLESNFKQLNLDYDIVKKLLSQNAALGGVVEQSFKALGEPTPLLLKDSSDSPPSLN